MKISSPLVTVTLLALSSCVSAMPSYYRMSSLELAARGNHPECMYKSVGEGHCDDQGCRDGGGYCSFSAQTGRCSMVNMRGKGSPVGCQYCGCRRS
ncbi:hypothetical protein CVT26_003093 [Gymnopilus dilepis]|uniref:Uncharacterized protein n=1 Tax=Gymnopilus dilepis TaxID=231916 RepID=A0A409Y4Z6_9AGAR|nr:hypothetical protein CVT26_003093 [Gymnopilus dilepis]